MGSGGGSVSGAFEFRSYDNTPNFSKSYKTIRQNKSMKRYELNNVYGGNSFGGLRTSASKNSAEYFVTGKASSKSFQ